MKTWYYTVTTSWDNFFRCWDVKDSNIDWIQQIDEFGNMVYPKLEDLPEEAQN